MLLHQRLRRLAESRRTAIGAKRQAGGLARDGARLGARAEGSGNAVRHGGEYGRFGRGMEALSPTSSAKDGQKFLFLGHRFALKLPIAVDDQRHARAAD